MAQSQNRKEMTKGRATLEYQEVRKSTVSKKIRVNAIDFPFSEFSNDF